MKSKVVLAVGFFLLVLASQQQHKCRPISNWSARIRCSTEE